MKWSFGVSGDLVASIRLHFMAPFYVLLTFDALKNALLSPIDEKMIKHQNK